MKGLAFGLWAVALFAAWRASVAAGAGLYWWGLLAMALVSLGLIAFDVSRFRALKSNTQFETMLGRGLLAVCATVAAPVIIGALTADPELIWFMIFVCGFGLFGVIFRFAIGRPDTSRTPGARRARKDMKLTGALGWRDGRIEEFAARGRISPWPARALLVIGVVLAMTGALKLGIAAFAGLVFIAIALFMMEIRRRSMPNGVSVFAPTETPIRLSNGVGGGLYIPKPPAGGVSLTLTCVSRVLHHSGANGERTRLEIETLWEGETMLEDGAFAFLPPEDLPEANARGDRQIAWSLTATGAGYRATFRLPVKA